MSYSVEFCEQKARTLAIVSGFDLLQSSTAVFSNSVILGSSSTFSSKTVSKISALPSGLRHIFSTRISSSTPPSRDQRLLLYMCEVAPSTQSRTSEEALPPTTWRAWAHTTHVP